MTPIRDVVTALMLSLRRRYLERYIDAPFDARISTELDGVVGEQECMNRMEVNRRDVK